MTAAEFEKWVRRATKLVGSVKGVFSKAFLSENECDYPKSMLFLK